VDDESRIRRALSLLLEERGFETVVASGGAEALARLEAQSFALMLCDVAMPGMSGIELLEEARRAWPDLPVIMISAHGELEMAVPAVRAGAYDYLLKPIDEERLFHTIDQALELHRLAHENRTLRQETAAEGELLGQSPCMMRLREEIARAAPSEGRILILGENGVGKEVVARLIHDHSLRRDRPFVKVNSAAIPRDLIESELFGHEAGAFTGATRPRKGKLESADGGTLFLDEIGELPVESQARLLRMLDSGEVRPLGADQPLLVVVRILAATHTDVQAGLDRGRFRQDLFYRLSGVRLCIPPLRHRFEDLELLVEHFTEEARHLVNPRFAGLSGSAIQAMRSHDWPGNIRELRHEVFRLATLNDGKPVKAWYAPPRERSYSLVPGLSDGAILQDAAHLTALLVQYRGRMSELARALGVSRSALYRALRRHGIDLVRSAAGREDSRAGDCAVKAR